MKTTVLARLKLNYVQLIGQMWDLKINVAQVCQILSCEPHVLLAVSVGMIQKRSYGVVINGPGQVVSTYTVYLHYLTILLEQNAFSHLRTALNPSCYLTSLLQLDDLAC